MTSTARLLLASAASLPFVSEGPSGVMSVRMSPEVTLEVVASDTSVNAGSFTFTYRVEGARMVSRSGADTLFWVGPLPREALSGAALSGAGFLYETRTLRILNCTDTYVGGLVEVETARDGRGESSYRAFRTWLLTGVPLDLDAVVQTDSLFRSALRSALGAPESGSLDSWLWLRGFWLDSQSFLILPEEGSYILRIGLPSWKGLDSMLVVDLDLGALNTAHGAMLD